MTSRSDVAEIERAIRAECDELAGEAGFCFWPKCDCEKVPERVCERAQEEQRG
ncbi:MAG TPA: hypothetical protein VF442_02985 [Sphingobium sp.]